jgi:hypothetical protein
LPSLAQRWRKPKTLIDKASHLVGWAILICGFVVRLLANLTVALTWTIYVLAILAKAILDRPQFSGIMLLSGALMFVIAKGMIWWHLLEHL